MVKQSEIILPYLKRGYHLITSHIEDQLDNLPQKGLLHLFIQHTSAGLTINENADPSVRVDFENIFNTLVPERGNIYVHADEGIDDMPAHIKASLLGNSVCIPITNYRLNLGTWQGIYLCEFRNNGGRRKIIATIYF